MLKVLSEYCENNQTVQLISDGVLYATVFKNNNSGADKEISDFTDYDTALTTYRAQVNKIHTVTPSDCNFYGGRCSCAKQNCPASLGGAAHWQKLRETCIFRVR